MRITNNMLTGRVVYNMQRALRTFFTMQTQMSTGKRINKSSDDPIGTQRDLQYREELSKNAQYKKNIDQAQNWMDLYDSTLGEMKNGIQTAKELAIEMANGVFDADARNAAATEIESIFQRMVQLGNQELEDRAVFGGFRTNVRPLVASANGVSYVGDNGNTEYQIDSSSYMQTNLLGSDTFLRQLRPIGDDANLNIALSASALLADLHSGNGVALGTFTITDDNLGITSTIDLTGAVTVQDAINAINTQLTTDGITNLVVGLGIEKNNLSFDTTQSGRISTSTALDKINSGSGLDLIPGKIRVTDGGAIDFQVDLSGSATLNDIITKFNTQLITAGVNNVTMAINGAGTALEITDANGVPLGLSIENESSGELLANQLGITGAISPVLSGTALNPEVGFTISEIAGTTATDLGLKGTISSDWGGGDLDPKLLATSLTSGFNNGIGWPMGQIKITQGGAQRSVDLTSATITTVQDVLDAINNSGLDITASVNANGRGIQISNDDQTKSLIVEDLSAGGRVTRDLGIFGASDAMGSLNLLITSLRNNDQDATGRLLRNLDDGIQHFLNVRATVGAKSIRLESTAARLIDLDLGFKRLLSEVEDADLAKLSTDLATYENNYRASLIASAKLIQPTLMDFLR
ncbi:MAG: flagellar hook-associated protein FlgL [Candidatus Zixiibacteriota bacterium]